MGIRVWYRRRSHGGRRGRGPVHRENGRHSARGYWWVGGFFPVTRSRRRNGTRVRPRWAAGLGGSGSDISLRGRGSTSPKGDVFPTRPCEFARGSIDTHLLVLPRVGLVLEGALAQYERTWWRKACKSSSRSHVGRSKPVQWVSYKTAMAPPQPRTH